MEYFLEQIEEHKDEFYRYIYRNVWDSGVVDDVFSSAVLTVYQKKEKFIKGTNFRAWMYRILTNKCFVANRQTSRSAELSHDVKSEDFIELGNDVDYKDMLDNPEEFLALCGDEILMASRKLSTAERSCILLKDSAGFKYKEIAEILNIPVGTVMTHLSRGRAKMRRELMDYAKKEGIIKPKLQFSIKDVSGEKEKIS
jgi:RNA polymerase sigma-70 factor (ECF subfamily)